jgi:hypothetical protein
LYHKRKTFAVTRFSLLDQRFGLILNNFVLSLKWISIDAYGYMRHFALRDTAKHMTIIVSEGMTKYNDRVPLWLAACFKAS